MSTLAATLGSQLEIIRLRGFGKDAGGRIAALSDTNTALETTNTALETTVKELEAMLAKLAATSEHSRAQTQA